MYFARRRPDRNLPKALSFSKWSSDSQDRPPIRGSFFRNLVKSRRIGSNNLTITRIFNTVTEPIDSRENTTTEGSCDAGAFRELSERELFRLKGRSGSYGWPDEEEFSECISKNLELLRRALGVRLASVSDVEDCLSLVFEKLWCRGASIPPAARRAWLLVVAKNEASLLLRKSGKSVAGMSEKLSDDLVDPEPLPWQRVLQDEERVRLAELSAVLSADQLEVIRFRFGEGLTFQEIANRLRIPLGTVLSRVRGAIMKLRRELEG